MSPDAAPLLDMLLVCRRIQGWIRGMTFDAFREDERTQFAVQHQLMVLGEATKRLSEDFRIQYSSISWRQIAGLRDVLIHGYHRVSLRDVTATEYLPPLTLSW